MGKTRFQAGRHEGNPGALEIGEVLAGDQTAGAVGELEGDAVAGFGGDEAVDDTAIA